jgi:hypothetical protein
MLVCGKDRKLYMSTGCVGARSCNPRRAGLTRHVLAVGRAGGGGDGVADGWHRRVTGVAVEVMLS